MLFSSTIGTAFGAVALDDYNVNILVCRMPLDKPIFANFINAALMSL
jgi:hypothetical protein